MAGPKKRRRRLQFSVRTLFVLTTVVALWLGMRVQQARRQQETVQAIRGAGGKHLEHLTELEVLGLQATGITDNELEHLSRLTSLKILDLKETRVTDAGL